MPNITLAIPKELKEEMDELPELNFSEIARQAIAEAVSDFREFKNRRKKKRNAPATYQKYEGGKK